MIAFSRIFFAAVSLGFLISCGESETAENVEQESVSEKTSPPPKPAPQFWDNVKVHAAIREKNPDYTGNGQFQIQTGKVMAVSLRECRIKDVSFMAEMPDLAQVDLSENQALSDLGALKNAAGLQVLYLENTGVKDLSPLEGRVMQQLYLTGTLVKELSPLQKMQVKELNLVKTPVESLANLAGAQVGLLWLTDCPVTDISGLEKVRGLESVTLHRTKVKDLSPLAAGNYPKGLRLHIGETPVTDLTPLARVPLTRLVFTPGNIEKGLDEVKQLPMLREIGTKFDDEGKDLGPPAVFWQGLEK